MADPTVPPPAARGTEPTREPMSEDRLELARNHTRRLVRDLAAEVDRLRAEREVVMQEAFMTGRIYHATGERETPMEIHAKLHENCEKAVRRAVRRARLRGAPSSSSAFPWKASAPMRSAPSMPLPSRWSECGGDSPTCASAPCAMT